MNIRIIGIIVVITALAALTLGAGIDFVKEWSQGSVSTEDAWGATSEGFQLSARLRKERVRSGEPILLKLTLKNATVKDLCLERRGVEREYQLEVKNERGERVPPTEAGMTLINNAGEDWSHYGVKLGPGKKIQDEIEVNKLWEMTAPGTYYITATRPVSKQGCEEKGKGVSNTIEVSAEKGATVISNVVKVTVTN